MSASSKNIYCISLIDLLLCFSLVLSSSDPLG